MLISPLVKDRIARRLDALDDKWILKTIAYWVHITPLLTTLDIFHRWLFALLSVHTSWQQNVKAFLAIKELGIHASAEDIYSALCQTGAGMQNDRIINITAFRDKFLANPSFYMRWDDEPWLDCRKRLMDDIRGLAYAKTSFALEMLYPVEYMGSCLDTWMLKLFNQSPDIKPAWYLYLEQYWLEQCIDRGFPPAMVRHVYYNDMQYANHAFSTDYWSRGLIPACVDAETIFDNI